MKRSPPGKFIVLEGIDGAGCETQTRLLFNYFRKQNKSVEKLYYPDYRNPIGKLIHQYLHKVYEFPADVQLLLYCADFLKDKDKINKWLKQGKIIICDRYFTSTLAYQGLRGVSVKKALEFAELFGLPKPNLIIYLKVKPEISIKRKYKEKKKLDRNEADKLFLTRVAKYYQKLIKRQIFGKWVVIDGEKSINKVTEQIKKTFTKL